MFVQLKALIIIVLSSMATMLVCDVSAVGTDTERRCKKLLCPAAEDTSCGNIHCFMNDSTVTFEVHNFKLGKSYVGFLIIYNQTLCKVSTLQKIENTAKLINDTVPKYCNKTLWQKINLTYGNSSRFGVQLKDGIDGIFVFSIGKVSLTAFMCLGWEDYRQRYDIRACYENENFPSISPTNPVNRKTAETYRPLTYCVVVTFLLLEVLVCAVIYLCLKRKRGRTKEEEENSADMYWFRGNPIYQRGVQVLDLEPSDALNATQDSYQPLVENTREPGVSEDYRSLENEEGCDERNTVFVDQTGYEGLARSQTHKYQSLAKDKVCKTDQRKSDDIDPKNSRKSNTSRSETDQRFPVTFQSKRDPLDSLRNVIKSAIPLRPHTSSFSPNNHQEGDSTPFDQSTNAPLYYLLESPGNTAGKGPACTDTYPKESNLVPLQMRGVIEELKAGTTCRSVEFDSTKEEPMYHVLEGPNPTPDRMHNVIEELKSLNKAGQRRESSNECNTARPDNVFVDPRDSEDENEGYKDP